jgi:hypothetical protein
LFVLVIIVVRVLRRQAHKVQFGLAKRKRSEGHARLSCWTSLMFSEPI